MPLPPLPTQIADQVKLNRKETPDLKQRPVPVVRNPVETLLDNNVDLETLASAEWANSAQVDLSAAELALEKIKGDHRLKQAENKNSKRIIRSGPPTLFVLDTNVLMHDPASLFRFDEHDLYLPMTTLEELDNHKKGMSEVARNARMVSRSLDQLIAGTTGTLEEGIPLNKLGHSDVTGRLFFQTQLFTHVLPEGLPEGKGCLLYTSPSPRD